MKDFWNGLSKTAKFAFVVILVIVLLGLANTARAQSCSTVESAMQVLGEKYGETPIFSGDMSDGNHILVTGNSETGTWSVLTVQGEVACLRASGQSFTTIPAKPNI